MTIAGVHLLLKNHLNVPLAPTHSGSHLCEVEYLHAILQISWSDDIFTRSFTALCGQHLHHGHSIPECSSFWPSTTVQILQELYSQVYIGNNAGPLARALQRAITMILVWGIW